MTARKGDRRAVAMSARIGGNGAAVVWPCDTWRQDIAGFAREVLTVSPTSKQLEIFEAVLRGRRIAIRGGRKSGKTAAIAIVALWFYASFPNARVKVTAPTAALLDDALYRQIREYWIASQSTPFPLDGSCHTKAFSGIKSERFADVSGVAARDEGSVRGVSGEHVLYIIDEASDVPDEIFHAATGNLAAGGECRLIVCSNPTRAAGFLYDCFSTLDFERIHAPSEGLLGIGGLASQSWIDDCAASWGADSALYRIHVLGEFAADEQGRVFPSATVASAFERFDPTVSLGDLQVGIDPAGDGGDGDHSAFAVRRGSQIIAIYVLKGLSPQRHVEQLAWILETHRRDRELVRVCLDSSGAVGDRVKRVLRDAEADHYVRLRAIHYSDAPKQRKVFGTVRDELHISLAEWIRRGGAMVYDQKLEGELALPATFQNQRGQTKVTDKDSMRKVLGRSPDRLDAVCLAVWDAEGAANAAAPERRYSTFGFGGEGSDLRSEGGPGSIDPYRAEDTWRRRR